MQFLYIKKSNKIIIKSGVGYLLIGPKEFGPEDFSISSKLEISMITTSNNFKQYQTYTCVNPHIKVSKKGFFGNEKINPLAATARIRFIICHQSSGYYTLIT